MAGYHLIHYKLHNFTAHLPSSFHVRISISKFISHFKNKGKTQSVNRTDYKIYGEEKVEVDKWTEKKSTEDTLVAKDSERQKIESGVSVTQA